MRKQIALFITLAFPLLAIGTPKYPKVCEDMTILAREIATINDAMVEQMKSLEMLEQKQRQEWKTASDGKRIQMEKFCIDSKNKLLNIKKTINVIFQQAKK